MWQLKRKNINVTCWFMIGWSAVRAGKTGRRKWWSGEKIFGKDVANPYDVGCLKAKNGIQMGHPRSSGTSGVMRDRNEVVNSRLEYKLDGEAFRINAASSVIQWDPLASAVKTRSTSKFSESRMALAKQLNLSWTKTPNEGSTGQPVEW